MIETLPWEEVAGNPDKYIRLLEEKEFELQRETYKVRQELRLVRHVQKQMQIADEWRASGIPEQRQSDSESEDAEPTTAASGFQAVPRKTRILRLMAQDPTRQWKALEVANALNEVDKIKSVRVAADELAKAGSLIKLPNAFYQYAPPQQP
ncbi:hypothetical protein OG806_24680 [Streptomyces sp. NBC_00882]|uniref:hypothetical protein n=1 Tax=Streptomyces sp. NBC_00882 TaxID=2975856 RepID=UPI00386A0BF0|nr:hypothetical protein OG806_24680 [Streptomyces sp. NBC_00882]